MIQNREKLGKIQYKVLGLEALPLFCNLEDRNQPARID